MGNSMFNCKILAGVCMENGWILSDCVANISYTMFWKLYSAIFVVVPLVMFYRGITGRYKVEIKAYKDESSLGYAKRISEEDNDENNKCNNNR